MCIGEAKAHFSFQLSLWCHYINFTTNKPSSTGRGSQGYKVNAPTTTPKHKSYTNNLSETHILWKAPTMHCLQNIKNRSQELTQNSIFFEGELYGKALDQSLENIELAWIMHIIEKHAHTQTLYQSSNWWRNKQMNHGRQVVKLRKIGRSYATHSILVKKRLKRKYNHPLSKNTSFVWSTYTYCD